MNGLDNKTFGDVGEKIAAGYLQQNGYRILEKKYKAKSGEIDIIAAEKDWLVFVEVKTRSSSLYGRPAEAVDRRKQQNIIKTAQWYLSKTDQYHKMCRFDIIEVMKDGEQFRVHQIKNAFE